MEAEEQEKGNEGTESQLHPLVQPFAEPARNYFLTMDNFYDKWDDATSDRFKEDIVEYCRETTKDYLLSVIELADGYEAILKRAQSLTSTCAGFGKFLSIIDIEVIAERQMSRWFFNRDDQRW